MLKIMPNGTRNSSPMFNIIKTIKLTIDRSIPNIRIKFIGLFPNNVIPSSANSNILFTEYLLFPANLTFLS